MNSSRPGLFHRLFLMFHNEIHGVTEDRYVHIGARLDTEKKEFVPFARHSEVPDLGENLSFLIAKAEKLFPVDANDENRLKWLLAQHRLSQDGGEWIMKPITAEEQKKRMKAPRFPKWGLTGVGDTVVPV